MNLTELYSLATLDANDPAAVALGMQRFAEDVEALLVAQKARATAARRPRMTIWQNGFAWTGLTANQFNTLGSQSSDIVATTDPDAFTTNGGNGQQWNGLPGVGKPFTEAGLWEFGFNVNLAQSGSVTANSRWQAGLYSYKQTGLSNVQTPSQAVRVPIVVSAQTGGEWYGGKATIDVDQDLADWALEFTIFHTNAASTLSIPAGALITWVRRLGDDTTVVVS